MKDTLAILNKILIVVVVLAAVFFGFMLYQFLSVPEDEYQAQVDAAAAQADTLKQQKTELEAQVAQTVTDGEETILQDKSANEELTAQLEQLKSDNEAKTAELAEKEELLGNLDDMQTVIEELKVEYGEKIRQLEDMILAGETDIKICYITLDDGPTNITDQFVDKLAELDAYATFFTIGANAAQNQEENLRKEAMGGNNIANHSFSHGFDTGLYSSMEEFTKQVKAQDEKVYNATGFHTNLFRFPAGSYYCGFRDEAIKWLNENGYGYIDWSANAYDSGVGAGEKGAVVIAGAMTTQVPTLDIAVLLCHDWNYGTLGALDIAIPKLREQGYVFLPLFPQSVTIGNTSSQFG